MFFFYYYFSKVPTSFFRLLYQYENYLRFITLKNALRNLNYEFLSLKPYPIRFLYMCGVSYKKSDFKFLYIPIFSESVAAGSVGSSFAAIPIITYLNAQVFTLSNRMCC